jgi:hypothetical protein
MKYAFGLMLSAAVLAAAVGCGTTEQSYMADQPPPLAKADPDQTLIDPVRLPAAHTRVSADEIDDANVLEQYRTLEAELKAEKRSMSKAGK